MEVEQSYPMILIKFNEIRQQRLVFDFVDKHGGNRKSAETKPYM